MELIEEFTTIGINYDDNYIHVCCVKAKERELWVIHNSQEQPLTDNLREKYNISFSGFSQDASTLS